MADYLCLESVRKNIVNVMVDQIARDCCYPLFSFEDIAGCAILLLDGRKFLFAPVAEEVLELGVESMLVLQRRIRSSPLVEDLQRSSVVNRIHQLVGVDVFAEALHSSLVSMFLSNKWSSGKGNTGGIREGLEDIFSKVGALRSVRLSISSRIRSEGLTTPKRLA